MSMNCESLLNLYNLNTQNGSVSFEGMISTLKAANLFCG